MVCHFNCELLGEGFLRERNETCTSRLRTGLKLEGKKKCYGCGESWESCGRLISLCTSVPQLFSCVHGDCQKFHWKSGRVTHVCGSKLSVACLDKVLFQKSWIMNRFFHSCWFVIASFWKTKTRTHTWCGSQATRIDSGNWETIVSLSGSYLGSSLKYSQGVFKWRN